MQLPKYFWIGTKFDTAINAPHTAHMELQPVLLKAFRGEALIRWLVDVGPRVAYVTDAVGLDELRNSGRTARLIGFPREDVFVAEDTDADRQSLDWSRRLRMW